MHGGLGQLDRYPHRSFSESQKVSPIPSIKYRLMRQLEALEKLDVTTQTREVVEAIWIAHPSTSTRQPAFAPRSRPSWR